MTCVSCGARIRAPDRYCANCGALLQEEGSASREARKHVSILFLDIIGSTALTERLDPEPLRQVMDRYFTACAASILAHGGVVEKFIGDAILAAFGATIAHEDDAHRAVRAAAEALAALGDLNADLAAAYQVRLEARCGICSGEVVVAIAPGGDFRIVGDVVNTASRMQEAARPGEILIDAGTAAIVRSQVGIQPVPPLNLKGKAQAVPAWRVTKLEPAAPGDRESAARLVGRTGELAELVESFRLAKQQQQVRMVTVFGTPGIGKSRLVREFVGGMHGHDALVLSGRCSPYGKGVTYKPLADMLGSYPGGWAALVQVLSSSSSAGARAASILETITGASAVGAGGPGRGPSTVAGVEEIAWAVRCLLQTLGKRQPVITIWEDLHWCEATLLDLIEEAAAWINGVPVLLLCIARTELLESRPSWGRTPQAVSLELGPLTHAESAALVTELVMRGEVQAHGQNDDAQARITAQCEGNPLFAELIVDVFAETAPSVQIPPTIQALLGARLDRLPIDERRLLEMATVIGREFSHELLRAMADADGIGGVVADELTARLIRRRILERGGPGTLRFAQTLMRDIAYSFTAKARRERWHTFLARWLDMHRAQATGVTSGGDSLALAYHVEAAFLLRKDLRPGNPALPALAATAAGILLAEGMNALNRKDLPAAVSLLERGRELLPAGDVQHTLVALRICDSALGLWDDRCALAALAAAEAALPGSRPNAVTCAIQSNIVALRLGLAPPQQVAADARLIAAGLRSDPDEDLSWCRLHQLEAYLHLAEERAALADESFRLALERARAMGDAYEEERLLCAICELAQWVPTHLRAGLELCVEASRRFGANRALLVPVLVTQAHLTAIAGDIDGARELLAAARTYTGDLHLDLADAAVMEMSGIVESLAGAHDKAETHYRQSMSVLRTARQAPELSVVAVATARELFEQGQVAAAAAALDDPEVSGPAMNLRARIAATALRSRIASARGHHDDAVAAAREAGELSDTTDDLCLAGEAFFDLAIVLKAAGMAEAAMGAATRAMAQFDAKGAALLSGRIRDWLSALGVDSMTRGAVEATSPSE
jgi:class 3 adenylate cyclase/tetratricopeptide (TPR) repeat protein